MAGVFSKLDRQRSPFGALLTIQLKTQYGSKGLAAQFGLGEKRARYSYIFLLALMAALIPWITLMVDAGLKIADIVVPMGQPGLMVVTSLIFGQMVVLFFGISHVMSAMYYSNDLDTLKTLPFRPREIMMAKIGSVYLGELLFGGLAALPFAVALGIKLNWPSYWLRLVVLFLFMPAIPIALSVLALVPLMKLTSRMKNRDTFRVIYGLLFFALILAFQVSNTRVSQLGAEGYVRLFMERNGLVKAVAGYYPPAQWAADALTGMGLSKAGGSLLLFCLVSGALLYSSIRRTEKWFFEGTGVEYRASANEKEKVRAKSGKIEWRQRSELGALVAKEHFMLTRIPNHFLTALLNLTIAPLLVIIQIVSMRGEAQAALDLIMSRVSGVLPLLAVGFHGLLVGSNQVASTAISREGKYFTLSKSLPIPPKVQVKAKELYGLLYAALQLAILTACYVLLFKSTATAIYVVFLGALISWPVTSLSLICDLMRPNLKWTEPQQAMKGNIWVLVAMGLTFGYLVAMGGVVKLLYEAGKPFQLLIGVSILMVLTSGCLFQRLLDAYAEKRYAEIEL